MEDKFILGGKEFQSRFILGSGKYNLNLIKAAVRAGRCRDHYPCAAACQYKGE